MDNKSHFTVYKASAGSGKTFRLAVQYITMLIREPESYRHILAVTFTNKATAEMKQRILSQLYGIGHSLPGSANYYAEVKKAVSYNEQTIRHNALLALDMILQDYGRFRVETIDSFFQTVLRSLARELHIGANLSLELDTELVIDEAVDSFLAGIEQGSNDKRNVMEFVENNIDNDKNWSIDITLKKFAQELFREIFMERGDELRKILSKPDAISDYKQNLTAARDSVLPALIEKVKTIGAEIESALSNEGLGIEGLSSNPGKVVVKIINATILDSDLGATFSKCIQYPDSFFRKKDLRIADIATQLHTNTTYISATLNSGLGMSFPRFVTSYRVRYAQEQMLRFPEKNLSRIAEEAGFANDNSFFRAFKTETGLTPTEWREKHTS